MRPLALARALALALLLAPVASALSVETWREGEVLVVVLQAGEAGESLDLIVSHEEPGQGSVIDRLEPVDLKAGERREVRFAGLPDRSYDVRAAPRGEVEWTPPAPTPTPAPTPSPSPTLPPEPESPSGDLLPLTMLARDGVIDLHIATAFPQPATMRRASVDAGEDLILLREGDAGEVELVRSPDGGRTWSAPLAISGPAPSGAPGWTYWETTRFSDGALGVLHKEAPTLMPGRASWTLTRLMPDASYVSSSIPLQLPAGRTIPTDDRLELLTLPDARVLLIGQTFSQDPTPQELDAPSVLQVWRVTMDGVLHDEVQVPIAHGVSPTLRALLAPDGTVHLVWSHAETSGAEGRSLWTTLSTDAGRSFEAPRRIDVPFLGGDHVRLTGAAVDDEGALILAADAELPDGAVHWVPFLVRVPREGAPTQLDLRTIKAHPTQDRAGYSHVSVLAHGSRVWLVLNDGEPWIIESFDGGRTFDAPLRLRASSGGMWFDDARVTPSGFPVFAVDGDACAGCFGSFTQLPRLVYIRPTEPPAPWPGDILLDAPPSMPSPPSPGYVSPPMSEPGFELVFAALAVALVAAWKRRR